VRSNQFGFNLIGFPGASVVVEANLSNPVWVPVATSTLTGGTSYLSDAVWTNSPQRFYQPYPAMTPTDEIHRSYALSKHFRPARSLRAQTVCS